MTVIGIDLGGTKISAVLLDPAARQIIAHQTIPTEGKRGPDGVITRIADVCRALTTDAGVPLDAVRGIGVGMPCVIDYENGRTLIMANLPGEWREKPVAADLRAQLGRPIWLINDARAFSLAESLWGAGRGYPVVACFTLGTGIGGGVVINGALHMGMDNAAAEFGHLTVDINGAPDGVGVPGSIESLGSGPAIAAAGVKAVMQGVNTTLGALVDYDLNRITPDVIRRAAEAGDPVALDILQRAGTAIGAGIAHVVTILAPHCVILGGGVTALGDWILDPIRASLRIYCRTVNVDRVQIVLAALGADAGAIGAALWADQHTPSDKG
jgi:glucokinase